MQRINIEAGAGAVPYRVYDLSIADLKERQKKSQLFRSGTAVLTYLGISNSQLYENRKPNCRVFSKKHGKYFAVRIAKETATP